MIQKMKDRRKQKGFTLIELLIVIAIIGIIAALLVPNFLDALNKGRQKRTMGDMKNWGTAAMSWLSDQLGAGAAGAAAATFDPTDYGTQETLDAVKLELVPNYIQDVAEYDAWRNTYLYYLPDAPDAEFAIMVRSFGRGGEDDTIRDIGTFDPTDYAKDTVWADGQFLRKPEKAVD
jgi:prepilin-type N-terminal cleavage/methylation domain-containing protein